MYYAAFLIKTENGFKCIDTHEIEGEEKIAYLDNLYATNPPQIEKPHLVYLNKEKSLNACCLVCTDRDRLVEFLGAISVIYEMFEDWDKFISES